MDNPYRPPATGEPATDPRPQRPLRGVLAGLGTDIGGTFVLGSALALAQAGTLAAEGKSAEEIEEILRSVDPSSGWWLAGVVVGCLCSVVGGIVCVRVGRSPSWNPPAALAFLTTAFGIWVSWPEPMGVLNGSLALATLLSVFAGAWLGRRGLFPPS